MIKIHVFVDEGGGGGGSKDNDINNHDSTQVSFHWRHRLYWYW